MASQRDYLIDLGFKRRGVCKPGPSDLTMTIEGASEREPGVYAFVVGRRNIRYIGSARDLRERLRNYELTKPPYTAARVRSKVLEAIKAGQRVEVFTLDAPKYQWRDLEVDLAQGIEKSLIRTLKPDCWNIQRHAQRTAATRPRRESP
jgi:hypothetical protein